MADYSELVQAINKATSEWDFHIASCRQCAVWYYFGKAKDPPSAENLCEDGRRIVQSIILLLT